MKPGHETPINRVAARILSHGVSHSFDIKSSAPEWDNPPVMYPTEIKGLTNGRITVYGSLSPSNSRKLVCRCVCGRWVHRSKKAMLREKSDAIDMCSQCYGLARARRNEHHRRTGIFKDTENFY